MYHHFVNRTEQKKLKLQINQMKTYLLNNFILRKPVINVPHLWLYKEKTKSFITKRFFL